MEAVNGGARATRNRGAVPRFFFVPKRAAALAVESVVQCGGRPVEIGNDEAGIAPLAAKIQAGDDAPLLVPAIGRVAEFANQALLATVSA